MRNISSTLTSAPLILVQIVRIIYNQIFIVIDLSRKTAPGTYNLGFHTYSVPVELHDQNRRRLMQRLKDSKVSEKAVILLEGGKSSDFQRYSTDVCHTPFRQVCSI